MGNEMSQHIEHAQKTGVLQLRNFKLTKVPNEILPVAQFLRNLDLSNNRLQSLSGSMFLNMQILKALNLSTNKIEILPNEITQLTKLETLNLSENLLQQLPPNINQLKNLKQLYLSKNKLTRLTSEMCQLKLLDHLDLSGNKITEIDDCVEGLTCIELNLNENSIKKLSANVSKCPRLKVLRLQQNCLELTAIPDRLLSESKVSLINYEGNLFTQKQFELLDGYEKYLERYTATKRKFD